MQRFYRVTVTKRFVGTAIEHHEPALDGEVVVKVNDAATRGDFVLVVLDADDGQHERNLSLPGVEGLEAAAAIELAAEYQPARTTRRVDPLTRDTEIVDVPAVDLAAILAQRS